MPRTRSQRNVDGSKGNGGSSPQNPTRGPTSGDEGAGLSRIPPEQLVQAVAGNLPTFEAIVNYLKGQAGGHPGQGPKNPGEGLSESRTGSPNPQLKRVRRELTPVDVVEPSHKHSRTEHPELFRKYSKEELSPRKE